MTVYKLINPSDAYTLATDDFEVAAVACFALGAGHYALRDAKTDESVVPVFLFGGSDDWCREKFGKDAAAFIDGVVKAKRSVLADCLDGVLIGDAADRADFEQACSMIEGDAGVREFKLARHERRRSSMNNIGGRAYAMAANLRKPVSEAA